jgi:hypothetical protein
MVLGQLWNYINSWNPFRAKDSAVEDGDKKKWTEQLERSESNHQEEIQRLHQQHHQDMLSVINDCCRKLKTSFTRKNKPYDVNEIHSTIDDVEQKMVREILSEIEKTDAHEDLSSFGEALATSERTREVGQNKEFARFSSDDITASLNAFDVEDIGSSFSQDLESVADAVAAAEYAREPVVEENIEASRAMITGDRGNLYYTEELKRAVDDMIALGGGGGVEDTEKTGAGSISVETEPAPDLPEKLRSQSEVERSLESLIISGDVTSGYEGDVESLVGKDQGGRDRSVLVAEKKPGGKSKTSEVLLPETTSMDLDQLNALEAMVEGDFSWTDIEPPSSNVEPEVSKVGLSRDAVVQPATTTTVKSSHDQDRLKSHDATKVEGGEDFSWAGIPPPSKTDVGAPKSHEAVVQPASAASTKSPQDQARGKTAGGKAEHDKSAESAQDKDQLKALEEMLEAQMTDSPHAEGKHAPKDQIEPTKSAKQQLKSNVSEQVTSSALPTTETAKVTPRTGYEENPHYVEEVLGAAKASTAKDKP